MPDNEAEKLRAELFGHTPPSFEGDIGRLGKVEKAVADMPALIKKEINGIFSNWKGIIVFIIVVATFLMTTYKNFAGR